MTTPKLIMMIVTAQVAIDSIAQEVTQAIGPQAKGEVQWLVKKHLAIDESDEAGPVLCAHLLLVYHLLEHYRVSLIEYAAKEGDNGQVAGRETVQ